jgi:hypothetical protein
MKELLVSDSVSTRQIIFDRNILIRHTRTCATGTLVL